MLSFAILSIVVLALAVISCLGGTPDAYASLPMVLLWGALAVAAVVEMVRRRLWRRGAVFLFHVALLVILGGALVTHCLGTSERVLLRIGQTRTIGPLTATLENFEIDYYPGTSAPRDFVSTLTVDGTSMRVSMNRVGHARGYRFFQSGYEPDGSGTVLTVSHDPAGTAITYVGYGLLLLSMLLFIPVRCKMLQTAAVAVSALLPLAADATPKAVPEAVAREMGQLYVYHGGRVAPLSTLAREYTLKLTGSDSYCGLTPEQVLTGWLFYYDDWKTEPCIRIKDSATRAAMQAQGGRVALTDFFSPEGYRFDDDRHAEANEKFALASAAASGSIWTIYPYMDADSVRVHWLSPVSEMPADMPLDDWRMARHSLNLLAETVAQGQWERASEIIGKIGRYQHLRAGAVLPSAKAVKAERLFVRLSPSVIPAVVLLLLSVVLLLWPNRRLGFGLLGVASVWLVLLLVLGAVASGHLPMSNGYETMQWMALSACVLGLCLGRRYRQLPAVCGIVAALAMFVAFMGQRNPQVTQLMPVLRSPLLSIHVLTVMLAYAMFAVMALAGVLWLCGRRNLLPLARRMLLPAVCVLAAGIFIGAVWANMSWGRYWGWDPKEVWALITLLVYAVPLHRASLPRMASDRAAAIWYIAAFGSVIMTYFGVNFLLGGLHSYA